MPENNMLKDVSFIITTSPSPDNPRTTMIEKTINSATSLLGNPEKLIIAMDGTNKTNTKYEAFKKRIKERIPEATITEKKTRGRLTGNIENAINQAVNTKYIMVIQHDFEQLIKVDIQPLLNILSSKDNDVQKIRFNKRPNSICAGTDYHPDYEMKEVYFPIDNTTLMQTPSWSDNNHLCLTTYYTETVLPLCDAHQAKFPEKIMMRLSRKQPGKYGTYIYGTKETGRAIHHLDGKTFRTFSVKRLIPRKLSNRIKIAFKHHKLLLK